MRKKQRRYENSRRSDEKQQGVFDYERRKANRKAQHARQEREKREAKQSD